MARIDIQRFPGALKEHHEVPDGTFFYTWLLAQNLHRDIVIRINGVDMEDDAELDFQLEADHHIVIFDQPKGVIGDIISPIFKVVGQVFAFLAPKTSIPNTGSNSVDSPNNKLTGQTNTARLYQAKPDIYGEVRSYPDLIQESIFEYIDNLKYVTEFMCIGIGKYTTNSVRYSGGQVSVKILRQSEFDYFFNLAKPHAVTFTVNVTYSTASGNVTRDATFSGTLISATQTDNGATINPEYYYTFVIGSLLGDGQVPTNATINTTKFILNDNEALVIGPVFSPVDSTELWVHTQSQLGGNKETNWKVTIWKVDDDNKQIAGTTQTFNYRQTTPHDSTSEVFYRTDKLTPTGGYGRYAISFQRTDNSSDASVLKVEEIHAVNPRRNVVHKDDTLVRVKVRATENALGSRERKYNLLATRNTISYDLATQKVDYTLRPSRSFADAVAHTWLVMGEQDERTIDLYQLYSIAASLPDERLGYFDYTFDNEDDSLGERVQSICNAASVTAYWDSGVLTFTRDQKVAYPDAVFNRSNMLTDEYKISYEATLPGGYDGVQVSYVDPITNNKNYVNYRIIDGNIVEQEASNPNKIEVVGFRNEYQAKERALRETKRLLYSRVKMNAKVFEDGIIQVGSVVQLPDIYDTNQQQGYITGRSGNNFDTSEPIIFSGDMFVVVTDNIGNPTKRYSATPRSDTRYGFIAAIPDIPLNIWDGDAVQLPSRYIIATVAEMDSMLWTVNSITPNSDNTVSLTVSEYSDLIYS
ncbi:host specificity factor TipJ family phage tail protein [Mixta calida]|uniref:host specificity factor TipJ family phage tail protein n=1 Tax=Mixta calida TaxID=665913 RepID=UPI0028979541|nr:host specificity factor TipJ family phage tail protein [Mixta calida]